MNIHSLAAITIALLCLTFTSCQLSEDTPVVTLHTATKANEAKAPTDFAACILYISSEGCKQCDQAAKIFEDFTKNVEDIILTYSVDCAEVDEPSEVFLCKTKNRKQLPQIACYSPPTMKINPYTHKPMAATESFYQGKMEADSLSDFALKLMPVHRTHITAKKELKNLLRSKRIPTKVVLFTAAKDTSPMFKGLTSIYRDRVEFAEVKDSAADILEQEGVGFEELPLIIMYKRVGKGQIEKVKYDKDVNLDSVKEWIDPAALPTKAPEEKVEVDEIEEAPADDNKIPFLTSGVYEKKVLNEEKFVLIHIYKDGDEAGSWDEIRKRFGTMMEYYNMRISNSLTEEFARETLKATKFPSIKLLPLGTGKKATSKIFFSAEVDVKEMVKDVIELVDDHSTALSEKDFQMQIGSAFREDKKALIYFYKSGKGVAPAYKYLSHLTVYKEMFKFFSMVDPRDDVLKGFGLEGKPLPKLVMLFKPEDSPNTDSKGKGKDSKGEKDKDSGIQIAIYQGKYNYADLNNFFSQFLEKKQEVKRNVKGIKEIESHEDFEKSCSNKKSFCFIAFIKAEDRKSKDFESRIELLNELNEKFAGELVTISWIDAICHSYLLERVNLQEEILPQLLAYYPTKTSFKILYKLRFTNQIGTFEKESLEAFITRSLQGKVPRTKISEDIDIDEKNCASVYEERKKKKSSKSSEDEELEKEIMREIMEENKRKEVLEKEEAKRRKKEEKKNKKNKNKKSDL